MDFTVSSYLNLIGALKDSGYGFITFTEYLTHTAPDKFVILRHDVDNKPCNSLRIAKLEASFEIRAVYYFRAVSESWDEKAIREIANMGHEVGYHYESLTTCRGNVDAAYQDFVSNLKKLRGIVPVSTICMHGSPRSPYDSKDIWKKYSYRELDILGEPYLDMDFSKIFYLTDTGRRWDGYKVSVRDRIEKWQDEWVKQGLVFHSTGDIINAANRGVLPKRIMITTHPQRWNEMGFLWYRELLMQNIKNVIKSIIVKKR